ncbi:FecR family protein [Bacteroides heparinolyticus]|uniref:FecR family protein n=1 Tax=Prevotella heparinolytica TaxID=28113 RepID=UPI00359FA2EB
MKDIKKQKMLFRRYLDNLYTSEEVHKLMDNLQHFEYTDNFDDLASDVWRESVAQQSYTDLEREQYKKEARRLLKRIGHGKSIWLRRIAISVASVAAILCLILGSIKYWNHVNESPISFLESSTSYGERKQVRMPDGTLLTLNSCSRVRYPDRFEGNERKVELEGEGYFDVKPNEKQPFIVDTRRFHVRVLGTCFNVKSYSSDEIVSVDVESGKVQIDLPEAMMRLRPHEQIFVNTISGDYSKRREKHTVAVWRRGGLHFNCTPIRDVAKELERMYDCRITFAEKQKFNNLISGEHDNKNLEAVLQSIEYTSGIRYKKEGKQILLYK